MASTKVVDLLSDVSVLLLDESNARWSLTELQRWLNAAYRELITFKPDASIAVGTYNCSAGVRQNIASQFTSAIRLLDVVRNMASSSDLSAVSRAESVGFANAYPSFAADTQSISIDYYLLDERLPLQFLVHPPATSAAQLEVVYESMPTIHALTLVQLQNSATTDVISVPDIYANALVEYILFRAFSKDSDNPSAANLAAVHYQNFQTALAGKIATDNQATKEA